VEDALAAADYFFGSESIGELEKGRQGHSRESNRQK
jgi:hypothetical protein